MSENNEINELAEIIKGLEKMSGDLEGLNRKFKEGFDKVNNRLGKIDANSKEVLERLTKINANLERKSKS
ncbi:hypothetical protein FQP34_22025 [Peribacillus simplex]|uniref:Uncharacterized protein n=1 Tax=Peribacillus simplex TaxID=1478 RepID=A0A8B5XU54_9BACI|nr:hypothetical protein [Peribacillus simplex]TVX77813.1 hypothetical protein FQP34_22025 [Peribacillus simplex]